MDTRKPPHTRYTHPRLLPCRQFIIPPRITPSPPSFLQVRNFLWARGPSARPLQGLFRNTPPHTFICWTPLHSHQSSVFRYRSKISHKFSAWGAKRILHQQKVYSQDTHGLDCGCGRLSPSCSRSEERVSSESYTAQANYPVPMTSPGGVLERVPIRTEHRVHPYRQLLRYFS